MYQVQMQFIPGYDNIWVARINPDDPIYVYDVEEYAILKAEELQAADLSRRQYRVSSTIVV
jgi:hypothetical protein